MICTCFHSVHCLFILLLFPWLCRSFLVWGNTFAFVFGVRSKKAVTKTDVKEPTTYVFFCEFCGFRSYIQVFNPFWVDFCVCFKMSHFIPLPVAIHFFQHHLLKRLSFPLLYILNSFVKNLLTMHTQVYFWALYCLPLICMSVFMPISYGFDYYTFAIHSLKSESMVPPVFFFFSQNYFRYTASFVVPNTF